MPEKGVDGFTVVFNQHLDDELEFYKQEKDNEVLHEEGEENTKEKKYRSMCLIRIRCDWLVRLECMGFKKVCGGAGKDEGRQ